MWDFYILIASSALMEKAMLNVVCIGNTGTSYIIRLVTVQQI